MIAPYQRAVPISQPVPRENICLLTFGGGGPRYTSSAKALAAEADRSGWFTRVVCVTPDNDTYWPTEFFREHQDFLDGHEKGFGNWLWKPFVVERALQELSDGDILVYMDSGCELSVLGGGRFRDYLSAARRTGGLFFSVPFSEQDWTSGELLDRLRVSEEARQSPQIQATWFILKVSSQARKLARDWLDLCLEADGRYLSGMGEANHRHDQSVLSLLVKSHKFAILEWEDYFNSSLYVPGSWILDYPVHSRRARKIRIVFALSRFGNLLRPSSQSSTKMLIFRVMTSIKRGLDYMARLMVSWRRLR